MKATVAIAMIDMREMIAVEIGYNGEFLATVRLWNWLLGDLKVCARGWKGR